VTTDRPAPQRRPHVVTISAPYGAGGSIIGPAVARRLGVPFIDRAIPVSVASSLSIPLERALAHDQRRGSLLQRLLQGMALAGSAYPEVPSIDANTTEEGFREESERAMRKLTSDGGVILGRAGAVVLADLVGVLHVRLDGPEEARINAAMAAGGIDRKTATARLQETDKAREDYARHFYKVAPRDPKLYHLVIDSTALPNDTCVEIIASAAEARWTHVT
jgi:cytidylate kinase